MSDSSGFKPQAVCSAAFAALTLCQPGTVARLRCCFPMGWLQRQHWSLSAPDGLFASAARWEEESMGGDAGCFSGRLMGWQNPQGFVLDERQKSQPSAMAVLCGDKWGVARRAG